MTTVGEPIEPEVWRWYHKVVGKGDEALAQRIAKAVETEISPHSMGRDGSFAGFVLGSQPRDETVDAAFADLLRELVAVVGHQADSAHRDVMDFQLRPDPFGIDLLVPGVAFAARTVGPEWRILMS